MNKSKKKSSPYDKKNDNDFSENTKAIETSLEWMEKNVDTLSLRKISAVELSKRTGLHRNTFRERGVWIKDWLDKITEIKRERVNSGLNKITIEDKWKDKQDEILKLGKKLELQRDQTVEQLRKRIVLEDALEQSKSALEKLAKVNLVLQKENEDLLKRVADNVTSIKKKLKPKK